MASSTCFRPKKQSTELPHAMVDRRPSMPCISRSLAERTSEFGMKAPSQGRSLLLTSQSFLNARAASAVSSASRNSLIRPSSAIRTPA